LAAQLGDLVAMNVEPMGQAGRCFLALDVPLSP
jgi:hypothetical protein